MDCNVYWIALFSQTGSEIINISKKLKRVPNLILTDSKSLSKEILKLGAPICYIDNSEELFNKYLEKNSIITLHGYLKIIPDAIVSNYTIYNGHPGLITKYPELKGFNPQSKAHKLNHKEIGTIIHIATNELDSGQILFSNSIKLKESKDYDLDYYYKALAKLSLSGWVQFLNNHINNKPINNV